MNASKIETAEWHILSSLWGGEYTFGPSATANVFLELIRFFKSVDPNDIKYRCVAAA